MTFKKKKKKQSAIPHYLIAVLYIIQSISILFIIILANQFQISFSDNLLLYAWQNLLLMGV